MGRPKKAGVDWISLDVHDGKTFTILQQRWGNDGFAFWVKLLRLLGRSEGLFFHLDETSEDYFFMVMAVDKNVCFDIINVLIRLGNIDRELWEKKKILWCQGLADRLNSVFRWRGWASPSRSDIDGVFYKKTQENEGLLVENTGFLQENARKQGFSTRKLTFTTINCEKSTDRIGEDRIGKDKSQNNARGADATDEPSLFVVEGENQRPKPKGKSKPKTSTDEVFEPPGHLADLWPDYLAVRRAKRAGVTPSICRHIVRRLEELAPNNPDKQCEILGESICRGWTGVFGPDENKKGGSYAGSYGNGRGGYRRGGFDASEAQASFV